MASAFRDTLAPSTCDKCGYAAEDTILVKDNKSLCLDCFQDLPEGSREDIGDPESRIFWDRFFNEMKKEITRKEEEKVGKINSEVNFRIQMLEMQRNSRLDAVNGHFELQRQAVDKYRCRMEIILLEDEERRKQKKQEAEARLLDSQQALEATIEQIEKTLESTPDDVINNCMEAEANIPNLKGKKDFDLTHFRLPPHMKSVLGMWLILYNAIIAMGGVRIKLMVDLIFTIAVVAFGMLVFFFFLEVMMCCLLTISHVIKKVLVINIFRESLTKKLTIEMRHFFRESLTKKLTIDERHFCNDLMSFEINTISCVLVFSLCVLLARKSDVPVIYQEIPATRFNYSLKNNL